MKIIRLKPFCTLLFTFFTLYISSAQKAPYNGFIVKPEGDTIHGYFKKANDFKRRNFCKFSETAESKYSFRTYIPSELKAYYIEQPNVFYKAFPITKPNGEENTIFAECLEKGAVDLYLSRSVYNGDNLILNRGNLTYELSVDVADMPTSKAVFKTVLVNCRQADAAIFNVTNSVPSFVKLVNGYNKCIDSSSIHYSHKYSPTMNVDISFFVGYSISRIPTQIIKEYPIIDDSLFQPVGLSKSFQYKSDAYLNPMFSAGAEFDLSCPALLKNLSFVFGLNYQYAQTKQNLQNYTLTIDPLSPDTLTGYKTINLHYISIPLLIKYKFLLDKKFSPYINAGVIFSLPLSAPELMNQTELEIPVEGFYNYSSFAPVSMSQLNGGIGVDYNIKSGKSLFLEFRFNKVYHADVYDTDQPEIDYDLNYSYNFHFGIRF